MSTPTIAESRPLIPGWERIPPTPDHLRPLWDAARAAIAGRVSRLNYRAFVEPAQLLACHELPSIAVIGIVPSAELFFTLQAGDLVAGALTDAVGRPVEVRLEVFRHVEASPPAAGHPSPGPPAATESPEAALRRRRPGEYRRREARDAS